MGSISRHSGYDNLRGILIILVVLSHFLELCPGDATETPVYLTIYSFHMPAFIFLSGLFSKYSKGNMRRLAAIYILFQLLYRSFARFCLGITGALTPSAILTLPYWLLWYLPVLLYCQSLLPLWAKLRIKGKVLLLFLSVFAALVCGYCPQIGYPFTLSRFFVFLPYFLAGKLFGELELRFTRRQIPPLLCAMVFLSLYLCASGKFKAYILYGSYPYNIGYSAGIRLQAMLIAVVWICLLISLAQTELNKPIPLLSYIGTHTLPIYLLHGLAVKYISALRPSFTFTTALLCSAAIIAVTGNPCSVALFDIFLHTKK